MSGKKKVLIISYYWPPSGGSGVQRWLKIVKYLNNLGWEPIVYTPENPEYPEIDTTLLSDIPASLKVLKQPIWEPYHFYKMLVGLKKDDKIGAGFMSEKKKIGITEKISVWLRGNLFIPDARMLWIKPSVKFLSHYIDQEPGIKAIISTGPPHSMHLIAQRLHQRTGIPWLADFCDPWTSIDFYNQLQLTYFADKKHRRLERNVLQSATKVVVVTRTMASEFEQLYPRKYDIVTNGFDHADINLLRNEPADTKFSLSHIGSLVPSRNPAILWKTLQLMVNKDLEFANDLEIKLVGKVDHSILEAIECAGLTSFVRRINYLPHDKALEETRKSRVLLLLINQTPNAKGILTGKLFEYLAVKKPILCIGPCDGDVAEVLSETQSGYVCDFDDSESLEKYIKEYYADYRNGKQLYSPSNINYFSWEYLAGMISTHLDEITTTSTTAEAAH